MMQPLALALALTLGLIGTTLAQETTPRTPWYQVELIVFTQPGSALNSEFWSESVQPRVAGNAIELLPTDTAPVDNPLYRRGAFVLLDAAQHRLPLDPNHFNRNGYRPLFHGSWRQPLLPRAESRPIRIQGGQRLPGGTPELDGELYLDIARYLHLRTNLFFTQPIPDNWQSPLLPPISAAQPSPSLTAPTLSTLGLSSVEPAPRQLSVNLQQARRMRGGEVHYLDHPMFGLIIRLTPWEPPALPAPAETSAISEPPVPPAPADISPTGEPPALPVPARAPTLNAKPPQ